MFRAIISPLREIEELVLDSIGGEGVYILGLFKNMAEVETVARQIEPDRCGRTDPREPSRAL